MVSDKQQIGVAKKIKRKKENMIFSQHIFTNVCLRLMQVGISCCFYPFTDSWFVAALTSFVCFWFCPRVCHPFLSTSSPDCSDCSHLSCLPTTSSVA